MDRSNLTIILNSFHSFHHLKRITNKLSSEKFIIVENSNDRKVLNFFRKKKNIKVIMSKKNLGYGAGNNLGILHSKNQYCLVLNPDTELTIKNLQILKNKIFQIKNFGILLPRLKNKISINAFKNTIKSFISIDEKCIGKHYASGCCLLINKKKFKKKIFDENIFLYKEETDLIKRTTEKKIKCFLLKDCYVTHFGSSSHKNSLNIEAELFRNWHWMWSNFYYYKKHYGYIYSFLKFIFILTKSFIRKNLSLKKEQKLIYKARFEGLKSSMYNKKSWYRMKI